MQDLYSKIKNKRIELGWTQEELAKKMGYTDRSSIAKIESGKFDLTTSKIEQFADVLGVTPSWLMGWEDEEESSQPMPIETARLIAHNVQEAVEYYKDNAAAEIMQKLFTTPGKRALFDAINTMTDEEAQAYADLHKRLTNGNNENN